MEMEKKEVGRSKGIHISKYLGFLFQRNEGREAHFKVRIRKEDQQ